MGKVSRCGFTLIELLVVVAIIAVLVSILLPSLSMARAQAKAVKCGANIRNVGTAMTFYTSDYKVYPMSYVIARDDSGNYDPARQDQTKANGYVHWSYFLYSAGKVNAEAFTCPALQNGGFPRTNPGTKAENWESTPMQTDDKGVTASNCESAAVEDKQAPRMAYACNAAIVPRNKFKQANNSWDPARDDPNPDSPGNGLWHNRFVQDTEIVTPGKTILATEFFQNWAAFSSSTSGQSEVKCASHRPINVFCTVSTNDYHEYNIAKLVGIPAVLSYGNPDGPKPFDLETTADLNRIWDKPVAGTSLSDRGPNSVGRHHPGGTGDYSGTANFIYCDGHVDRKGVLETLQKHEWGLKYYSLTGPVKTDVIWGTDMSKAGDNPGS